jgi:hypothetical protein
MISRYQMISINKYLRYCIRISITEVQNIWSRAWGQKHHWANLKKRTDRQGGLLPTVCNLVVHPTASGDAATTTTTDSSVGIALGYRLNNRGSRIPFPAGAGNFSLHHRVQNGSGAHPASYTMGIWGSFSAGKAAGEWSWPLTST